MKFKHFLIALSTLITLGMGFSAFASTDVTPAVEQDIKSAAPFVQKALSRSLKDNYERTLSGVSRDDHLVLALTLLSGQSFPADSVHTAEAMQIIENKIRKNYTDYV